MDFQRILLALIFFFSIFLLWGNWQRYRHPELYHQTQAQNALSSASAPAAASATASAGTAGANGTSGQVPGANRQAHKPGRLIHVTTDMLTAEISTSGGNLQRLAFLKQRASESTKHYVLMQDTASHIYVAQSGLLDGLPDHNAQYTSTAKDVQLENGQDTVSVSLQAVDAKGARVTKTYTFHRGSYVVDVSYRIENTGKQPLKADAYFQFVRDEVKPEGESRFVPAYLGPAFYTAETKYHKVKFSEIEKGEHDYPLHAKDGWVAMLQHYFVAAWLPKQGVERENYMKALGDKKFSVGVILSAKPIPPGQSGDIGLSMYAGPAESSLDKVAPGLGYTVDYGYLTVLSKPMFKLLSWFHGWVHNWGLAIILLTLMIKLIFFPLSAASYRSMAKMRVVAPKLKRLKEQYADDRERLHKASMELYKTEKINPLGGCLPMMIQIPVFISLYWAILASVELRNAPFYGWITDLSSPDPYYVLPAIMAASMLLQTRLNPPPPDPMQARIMRTMPFIFGVVFFFFPTGLVLYSVVNNLLSILQQWYITRHLMKDKKAAANS